MADGIGAGVCGLMVTYGAGVGVGVCGLIGAGDGAGVDSTTVG